MSGTTKEEGNACSKEDEQHITCTDDMKNLHVTCTEVTCTKAKEVEEVDVCANCGKEDSNGLKACTACNMVKYCNRDCQIAHRPQHKKACRKRAAELHDERLFKQPPLKKDCPICMLPLPSLCTGHKYYSCCGKKVCSGCVFAPIYDHLGNIIGTGKNKCPFCRTPVPTTTEELVKRTKKRVEAGDANAIYNLAYYYSNGMHGMPRDHDKALECWHKAGELGYSAAYHNIGNAYRNGRGVERDTKKANHYFELAAMWGDATARHNLGCAEAGAGNWDIAIKHYMIAAGDGDNDSVKGILHLYKHGHATKEDYTKALLAYQKYLDEIRSEQRDKAAAADDRYKYY